MKTPIQTLLLTILILGFTDAAHALNVCPSSAPIPQTDSIKFYYDTQFPLVVGSQPNTRLEINHNGSASLVGGLLKKDAASGATPTCTNLNQMQQDSFGQWYCPGYLRVVAKADKPGMTSLTLVFVESVNMTQVDAANVFNTWPHCALGGIVPCQPGDSNAMAWLPFLDSVFPHSKQLNPINIKNYTQAVTLTDTSVSGYIQTNVFAPNHQEYLQLNVYQNSYPSWAPQSPKFFVYGLQAGGGGGACAAVAPLLPVQHNP